MKFHGKGVAAMTDRNGGGGQIAEELRALVSDAETLLRSTANAGGAEAQERAQATLQDLRARLTALEDQVRPRRCLRHLIRPRPLVRCGNSLRRCSRRCTRGSSSRVSSLKSIYERCCAH